MALPDLSMDVAVFGNRWQCIGRRFPTSTLLIDVLGNFHEVIAAVITNVGTGVDTFTVYCHLSGRE